MQGTHEGSRDKSLLSQLPSTAGEDPHETVRPRAQELYYVRPEASWAAGTDGTIAPRSLTVIFGFTKRHHCGRVTRSPAATEANADRPSASYMIRKAATRRRAVAARGITHNEREHAGLERPRAAPETLQISAPN
jgi:hypothetical protein